MRNYITKWPSSAVKLLEVKHLCFILACILNSLVRITHGYLSSEVCTCIHAYTVVLHSLWLYAQRVGNLIRLYGVSNVHGLCINHIRLPIYCVTLSIMQLLGLMIINTITIGKALNKACRRNGILIILNGSICLTQVTNSDTKAITL